jgi:hypothetical protein
MIVSLLVVVLFANQQTIPKISALQTEVKTRIIKTPTLPFSPLILLRV